MPGRVLPGALGAQTPPPIRRGAAAWLSRSSALHLTRTSGYRTQLPSSDASTRAASEHLSWPRHPLPLPPLPTHPSRAHHTVAVPTQHSSLCPVGPTLQLSPCRRSTLPPVPSQFAASNLGAKAALRRTCPKKPGWVGIPHLYVGGFFHPIDTLICALI